MMILKNKTSHPPAAAPVRNENMDRWEKKRKRGKTLYVFEAGLRSSVPTTAIIALSAYIMTGELGIAQWYYYSLSFLAAGFVQGYLTWNTNEKKYRQYLHSRAPKISLIK